MARGLAVRRDHLADFRERETELLGLENDRETIGVLASVAPVMTLADGAEQAAALIEAQGAQAYVELPRQVSDRIEGLVPDRVRRISGILDPDNVLPGSKHLR